GLRQLQEDLLWTAPSHCVIELPGHFEEKTPVLPRVRRRRKSATDPLDSTVAVHEGPVFFHICRGGQHPMGPGDSGILVGPGEDEEPKLARQLLELLFLADLRQ